MSFRLLIAGLMATLACAPGVPTSPSPTPVPGGTPVPTTRTPATPPTGTVPTDAERGREVRLQPPATSRFALQRHDTVDVALPNGDSLQQYTKLSAWVVTHATPAGDGFLMTFALDSLMASSQQPVPPAMLDSTRGTIWTADVAADGHIRNLRSDRSTLLSAQVESMLRLLVPNLPDATVQAGATWSDTTNVPLGGPDISIQEQATMNYVATGPAVRGARTALVLTGTGQFAQQGTATQFNQRREIDSRGSRLLTLYLGTDGVPAGFEGTETTEMTITIPAVGQSVQVRQRGTFRGTLEP